MRTVSLMALLLLILSLPARAADYWPDDGTRTYVFGSLPDDDRLVIDPMGGGVTAFRYVGGGCAISWSGVLSADGTLDVDDGSFFCNGIVQPVLEVTFPENSLLFDPLAIGGAIRVFQVTTDDGPFVVARQIGPVESLEFGEETLDDVVLFRLGIEDPLLQVPLIQLYVSASAGPIRLNGKDRTDVLDGIVRETTGSWGALKARY